MTLVPPPKIHSSSTGRSASGGAQPPPMARLFFFTRILLSLWSLTRKPQPLHPPAGFVTLSPGIYLSLPVVKEVPLEPNDNAPTVILIFGWMGALTRHLEVYSRKYSELYPQATQIIIKCDPSFFWTSTQTKRKQLLPVVEALEGLGCLSSMDPLRTRPRVLIHSFSNGGGYQLMALNELVESRSSDPLVSAVIFDSSPSIGTFDTVNKAFTLAIRNPIVRYPVLAFIHLVRVFRLVLERTLRWETLPKRYLKTLLAPRLMPWMRAETPRLYVFSKRDDLVPWKDVEEHAETARGAGLNVRCELYEESAHVSHVRVDPERYWESVQDLWQVARQYQGGEVTGGGT